MWGGAFLFPLCHQPTAFDSSRCRSFAVCWLLNLAVEGGGAHGQPCELWCVETNLRGVTFTALGSFKNK